MNRDIVAGNWKQLQGRMKVRWGLARQRPSDIADGLRVERQGILQRQSGLATEMADKQLRLFEQSHKGGLMENI